MALGLVGVVGGCGNARVLSSDGDNMQERIPTMHESRDEAVQATHEVVSTLEAVGLRPILAEGDYTSCAGPTILGHMEWRDDAGGSQYVVHGRLDLPDGRTGSEPFAREMRDALAADGWEPDTDFPKTTNGIQDVGDRWVVRAHRGYLRVTANAYASEQLVLFNVLGPCLPTTWEEREKYLGTTAERLDIGSGDEP